MLTLFKLENISRRSNKYGLVQLSHNLRQLCSTTDDVTSFSQRLIEKHYHPSSEAAEHLKKTFPQPRDVVEQLYEPFLRVDKLKVPALQVTTALDNRLYKSKLQCNWPVNITVQGVHSQLDTSVENAYLQACSVLKSIGLILIADTGSECYSKDHVIKILELLASKMNQIPGAPNFHVNHTLNHTDTGGVGWQSSLKVYWPISFTVTAECESIDLAFYQICLKAAMKLKMLGLLDGNNQFQHKTLIHLEKLRCQKDNYVSKDIFKPDYEIFVDASKHGIGAYLLTRDDDKIRWISDPWNKEKLWFDPTVHSCMGELYAVVTALWTWQKKFSGKRVLCYSDSQYAVNIINHGIFINPAQYGGKKRFSAPVKLYMLLAQTCEDRDIALVGQYIPRMHNVAADLLSRCDINTFKKIVPTACKHPKKSKKLWFCKGKDDAEPPDEKK